jgi:thiamine-monophosphate kinase
MPATPFERDGNGGRIESETELIQTYLAPLAEGMPGAFGLADDAALLAHRPGTDLVFSSDPIIAGVHFFPDDRAGDIAWKALACNVSDMAAKGAAPLAYLLTLALPEAPERAWVADFADGLRTAQTEFGCKLIGGDTDVTPGPLTIGITIIGSLPAGGFIPRHGAKAGDHVFITGSIGDAALGLALRRDPSLFKNCLPETDRAFLLDRYLRPRPRVALAEAVRTYARSALDISDGLLKDMTRLAGPASGIALRFDAVPLSPSARAALAEDTRVQDAVLSGGGDYELIVAVPPGKTAAFQASAEKVGIVAHDVGVLEAGIPVQILDGTGMPIALDRSGYDHFSR